MLKVESQSDVSDDAREAEKVASRARLRIGDLLQRPLGIRSIALTGLFILAVFYTIYFMRSSPATNCSWATAQLSIEADSTRRLPD